MALDDHGVTSSDCLKPVINIRSDVTVLGDGTMENQYTFS